MLCHLFTKGSNKDDVRVRSIAASCRTRSEKIVNQQNYLQKPSTTLVYSSDKFFVIITVEYQVLTMILKQTLLHIYLLILLTQEHRQQRA